MRTCLMASAAFAATGLITVSGVQGGMLGLQLENSPDIVAQFIDVEYDADAPADQLRVNGFALELDEDGVAPTLAILGDAPFIITATVNTSGVASGGTLTIGGTIPSLGFASGTLLTATLADFGSPMGTDGTIEFLWVVTGGDAAGLYGGVGAQAGTLLTQANFPGSWANDWDNLDGGPGTGSAVADTATLVPAPGSALFGAMLLAGCAGRRRRSA